MTKWLTLILVALIGYNVLSSHVDAQGSGTINQLSPFQVSGGVVRLASTTAGFRIPSLQSLTCLGTDSNGNLQLGTCTGGVSGGTDTLFNWNTGTNIISTDGSSTTATTSFSTNGFTANNATITNATSTTGWFSSIVRALNAVFTDATTTNLRTTQLGVGSDYITDLTGTGLSIVGNALTATNDHVAVTVSGARDYITLSGQDIVRGVVDVSDDTNLSGDTEVVLTGDALSLGESLTFTSATATNLASTLSTTSVFYGAGLTDCDTAGTSKLLWDATTGKFSCGTDQNSGGSGGTDVNWSWSSPNTFISPATTTNGIIVRASSTIGDGTGAGGLTVAGGVTTTANFNFGNNWNTLQAGLTNSNYINASTTGRAGLTLTNTGFGTAPEYRFLVSDPRSTSNYIAFGLTNADATAGGLLNTVPKDRSAYVLTQQRDLLLTAYPFTGIGGSVYLAASTTGAPQMKIDGNTGKIGIGMSTSSVPTSTLSVNGDIFTANITATGTASSTNASTSVLTVYGNIFSPKSDGCASWSSGVLTTTGTACGSGGGGGSISTSSIPVAGNLTYWTSPSTVSDVATGTLTETVTGLELSATRGLVGGSAILSLTSGFTIPTTSSTTEWGTFYQTPSTRITAGNHIDWTSNTLDVVTTGDWTGTLDGFEGATLAQTNWSYDGTRLTPTTSSAGILANGSSTLSLFNFTSATGTNATTTNLFATLGRFTTASSSYASTTGLSVSGGLSLFGNTSVGTTNALCILITGSADLCDGSDATGGGSGSTLATTTADYVISTNGSTVYAWNASTTATEFSGSFSSVLQSVVDKLDGSNKGGHIYIKPGRYVSDATTTIQGTDTGTDTSSPVIVQGASRGATEIIVSGSTSFLHLTAAAVVNISNMKVYLNSNGRGLTSSSTAMGSRAFWQSRFSDLTFTSTSSHTGIAMYLGNPFRAQFENIEFFQVGNCAEFRAQDSTAAYSAFNPGDFTFYRTFCEINAGGTTGFKFSSAGDYSRINQVSFDTIGVIGNDVNDVAFDLAGQTSHNTFVNLNLENVGTGIRVASGAVVGGTNNEFSTNYIYMIDGGTVLDLDSKAQNNQFDIGEWYNDGTVTLVKDANTSTSNRNIIKRVGLNNDGTILITNPATSTTIFRDIYGRNDGFTNATATLRIGNFSVQGYFGIGSTTPLYPLTVVGNSYLAGNATVTGAFSLNSETFSDLTGFGLSNASNALGIDTTGAADGECLVYESTGPTIDWASCGGAGGSKWTDGTNFTYLTNTTYDLALGSNATETAPFWWDVSATTSYIGNGGAGDSVLTFGPTGSEWTMGFDDTDDSFRISSSTSLGTFDFLRLYSTSSLTYNATSSTNLVRGFSAAFNGLPKFLENSGSPVENFTNGMVGSSFMYLNCDAGTMNAAATAETIGHRCGDAAYYEDATGATSANASVAFGNITLQAVSLAEATANSGAGFFFENSATPVLTLGSTTPRLSGLARVNAGASSTVYLGFTNTSPVGTAYEVMPTAFVGFIATSTYPNWTATVRTSASASTSVDTGVPSTSPLFFDIQTDSGYAYLWYGSNTLSKRIAFGTPVSIGPIVNTGVAPGFYIGRVLGGSTAVQAYLNHMEYWKRKPYMYYNY